MVRTTGERAWILFVREHFTPLVVAGLGSLGLGLASMFKPLGVVESLRYILGFQLVGLGLFTIVPWMVGRAQHGKRVHGTLPVTGQGIFALVLGGAFLTPGVVSRGVLAVLIFLFLLIDGAVQLIIALRRPLKPSRAFLAVSGVATLGLALWAAVVTRDEFWTWIGPLIGAKLIFFGAALLALAATAMAESAPPVYGSQPFMVPDRKPGDAYAVYIGNAFHLGIYVGNGEVVDFRNDNMVYLEKWEDYVLGRRPVLWEYPDLEKIPVEEVVAFARDQVGNEMTYNFMSFNCEHFVIWCKTLGRTTQSNFAQMGITQSLFENYPVLGSVVEVHTRIIGWVAYLMGGRTGQQLSIRTRYFGALLARRVVYARARVGTRKAS